MNAYVNELSFHGQFPTVAGLMGGLKGLWAMHELCRRYDVPMCCSRDSFAARPGPLGLSVRDSVLRHAPPDEKRIVLTWLDRTGPFWEEARVHDPAVWYLLRRGEVEELATGTGIAECAAYCLAGESGATASVSPSNFEYTPVLTEVTDDPDRGVRQDCEIDNFWELYSLELALRGAVRLASWEDIAAHAKVVCTHLLFSDDAFAPLVPQPFSRAVGDRIVYLLRILDSLSAAVQPDGNLNAEGRKLKDTFFTGHRALFTDSSDEEKRDFAAELKFRHPRTEKSTMFPWHGKVRMGVQYRIHFEWPKSEPNGRLPVVYIGPKRTKR
ncbi:MAG: hypothetical protein ACOYOU_00685 [Kiritimatiellia bacterium]